MALWWTLAIAVTCLSGLTSPGPVPSTTDLRELISELRNISQIQKAPLCNGTMVWSVNFTTGVYCAALDSLINISGCHAIHKTQRMLRGLCPEKAMAKYVSSLQARDTKVELATFVNDLRKYLQYLYRYPTLDKLH